MRILLAIDSLKGCLTSSEANEAAREGLLLRWPNAKVISVAVSDGGEGFLEAIHHTAQGGQSVMCEVMDPLMRPVEARYLLYNDRAYIELAQASGLCLLRPEERNPLKTTTYGTGQLIADALRKGVREVVVGLGGSATSDCGRGMLRALEGADCRGVHFTIATDVCNPLCGPNGAARVFAPQKGATEEMVEELERRAHAFAQESTRRMGHDYADCPGAGAAGGVGYALMQFYGAERRSGAELVLDVAHFDALLQTADLVITGEGHADRQTLMGKLPSVVLRRAQTHNVPVWLVAGRVSDRKELAEAGFSRILPLSPTDMPILEAMCPDVARKLFKSIFL
ncbi:MAG: glycerate kinase [Bacteroidaceae bacterium]|nr:glycerate kinase [Bacteroidaceae bacterium]